MSDIYDAALRRSAHIVARAVDPDELTALRAENERLNKSRNKWGQKYNKLLERHKVTRDELAAQIQWVKDLADKLIEEEVKTSALRAENKRLRAALEDAAKELELLYFFAISNGIAEAGIPPHVKARAALEEKS